MYSFFLPAVGTCVRGRVRVWAFSGEGGTAVPPPALPRGSARRRRMPPGRTLPSLLLALLPAGSAGTCTLQRVVRSMHVWIAISGHSSRTGAGFGCKGRSYWLPSHTSQGAGEVLAPMQPSLVDVRVARPRVVRSGHPRQKMKGSQGGQGRGPWRYAGGNGDRWPGSRLQEPSLRAWH